MRENGFANGGHPEFPFMEIRTAIPYKDGDFINTTKGGNSSIFISGR
jgi:hypothetical protein